jgi:hypothetical protein
MNVREVVEITLVGQSVGQGVRNCGNRSTRIIDLAVGGQRGYLIGQRRSPSASVAVRTMGDETASSAGLYPALV